MGEGEKSDKIGILLEMKNILIYEQQREIDWLKSEYVKGDDYYVRMNL